jgi:hypothetical protein
MSRSEISNLIGPDGRPIFGVRCSPFESFNLSDFRIYGTGKKNGFTKSIVTRFRLKRWEYIGVCSSEVIFGAAVVGLGYMTNMFAYVFDREKGGIKQAETIIPFQKENLFSGSSASGAVRLKRKDASFEFNNSAKSVSAKISAGAGINAELSLIKSEEPLCCSSRVGMGGFNYTHKEAGIPARGVISLEGKKWEIKENESSGVFDYTFGYLARNTFWNWAAGGGSDLSGNRIGFNLVQGINETGFTENAFWINGRIIKTDVMDFRYNDTDLLKPWKIESNDGKVDISFYPEGERSADINIGLVASRFHQPFGKFGGRLTDGKDSWEFKNAAGFTEEHYAKW